MYVLIIKIKKQIGVIAKVGSNIQRRTSNRFLLTKRVHTFSSYDVLSGLSNESATLAKLLAIAKCLCCGGKQTSRVSIRIHYVTSV